MIAVQFQSLHRRPANGTGADFRVSSHGKRGQSKPCPYCETTKCAKFHAHFLAVHCRGGALLHPRGLAAVQGFAGRAMLAPTIESQKSDISLRKPCPLLVGACIAGPPMLRPAFGTPAAHLSGRKHFPIAKKDPQTKPFAGLSSWCTISGSVQKTVQCTVFSDRSPRGECKPHRGAARARPVGDGALPTSLSATHNAKKRPANERLNSDK